MYDGAGWRWQKSQDISQEQQRKSEGVQKHRRDLWKDLQRREAGN